MKLVLLLMVLPLMLAPIAAEIEFAVIVAVLTLMVLWFGGFFSYKKRRKLRKTDSILPLDTFFHNLVTIGPWLIPGYHSLPALGKITPERSTPISKQKR